MSVIKIKGSSANTGDFTIQPPNSATDRTLTLPDAANGTFLTSTNLDVFVPFNNASLTSGASGTFTLSTRSKCLFSFGGASYKTSGTGMTLTLAVTTIGTIAQIFWYTNETASHKSSPPGYGIQTLDAGTWTVTLTSDANVDGNDRGSCSILAIPTA